MQNMFNKGIEIKFILITDQISFLPDNIINCCKRITLPRPYKSNYIKISKNFKKYDLNYNIQNIKDFKNIKDINFLKNYEFTETCEIIDHKNNFTSLCDNIVKLIINYNEFKFTNLREHLYDICIYDIDLYECFLYILKKLLINLATGFGLF